MANLVVPMEAEPFEKSDVELTSSGADRCESKKEADTKGDEELNEMLVVSKYVMSPDCSFRRRWDIMQAFILLYSSIIVPIRVGFKIIAVGWVFMLEMCMDIYFYLDLGVNFFTGYHNDEEGLVIMNQKLVARNYLRTWFTVDIIACIPFEYVLRISDDTFVCSFREKGCCKFQPESCEQESDSDHSSNDNGQWLMIIKLLRLIRLMKLLRLMRLGRLLERYQDDLFQLFHLISVLKLGVILLYLGHIFGCFFYFFSTEDWRTGQEKEYLAQGKISPWIYQIYEDEALHQFDSDFVDRYVASLYWAFTTMTTVGYGDISAKTRSERIFAIVGMIMGGFVFSGIISTMSEVLQAVNLSKQAKRRKIDCVSAFIRDAHLPSNFTRSVLAFFRRQDVKAYDERSLLMELPYELRHGILEHTYRDIIVKVPLFDVNGDGKVDDHVFVTELCSRMQRVSFQKGSLIYQRGEIATYMLIIWSGVVEVMCGRLTTVLTVLDAGSYFGEGALLGEHMRQENMRARSTCELCKLDNLDMMSLLQYYPHLYVTLQKTHTARKGLFDGEDPLDFEKLKNVTAELDETDFRNASGLPGESMGDTSSTNMLVIHELQSQVDRLTQEQTAMNKKLDMILGLVQQMSKDPMTRQLSSNKRGEQQTLNR